MKKNIIEFEIDFESVLDLPSNVSYHKINSKHLFIAPLIPSWLTFNDIEKNIFNCFLEKKTITQILNIGYKLDEIINVLAAIKFKKFSSKTKSKIRKNLHSATLYLTNECNLRCSHCYMFSGLKKEFELGYFDWFKIIDILKENGVKTVTLTGGEPMMKKGFFKILNYLNQKGIAVILITNATLITEENYKDLSEKCIEIQISLDGPNQELHEKIRGKNTFKKTINAIKLIAETNVKLFIAMTPTPETIDKFELFFPDFIRSSDFLRKKNVHLNITADLEGGRNISEVNRFKGDGIFYKKVKKIVDTHIEVNRLEKREMLALVPGEKKLNCGFGESFTVLWDGKVKRCFKDKVDLQIFEADLGANLNKSFRNDFKKTSVNNLKNCNQCDLRFICGGSCRVDNLQIYDNINIGGCDIQYKQHLYELLIKFDENQYEVL